MTYKKVAIITRTKNRPQFLERAIQSVASQNYQDYVHVIVNDGGDSEQVERIVERSGRKEYIELFHRKVSSGAPDTIFNESIDRVDSEYVAIHDDDDTWHSEFLKQTVEALDAGAKGVVVKTDKVIEEVTKESIRKLKTLPYMADMFAVSLYRQCIDNQLTPISFVYRRDVYNEIGKYDQSLPVVGDWEFGIRFLLKYDVQYIDPGFALAHYHHRKVKTDNSFAHHNHRKYVTQVATTYLRKELSENTLGVGYIMSTLKYDQDVRHSLIKRLIPKSIINRIKR